MKFFSTKVATDEVFCDRISERKVLRRCISNNEHCVVIAPRRYGKTSLVMQAIAESGVASGSVDLFCVVYEEEIIRKIAQGVSQIAQRIMSRTDKTLSFLEGVFRSAKIGIQAGSVDISVQFSRKKATAEHVEDLLQGLEKIAAKAEKSVVLFIDEFQDILKVEKSSSIQAAIRSIAQHSKYVTYIFSGSSRVMLEKIFDDSSQPLYMMCHKMTLSRIDPADFAEHIQNAAKTTWHSSLPNHIVEHIVRLTECHTYYVNALCVEVMSLESPPTPTEIDTLWDALLFQHKGKIVSELEKLSSNRIKVLANVALMGEVCAPNSRDFLQEVQMSLSSTQASIQYLLDNDYLFETENGGLKLVDPLMRLFLTNRY